MTNSTTGVRVVREGEALMTDGGSRGDRFIIDSSATEGRVSIVEHILPPRTLAAPVHIHTREDEFSYVVEGRLAARLGDEEVIAEVGDLVFKPRNQWHTFWNPTDGRTRIIEIISPGGLEELFKKLHGEIDMTDPTQIIAAGKSVGCDVDLEATQAVLEQHGLSF
jgi:mannose-6-phosphate isomerase-like protein (cupin superfamily)